ncbi:MAG: hypothetical protein JXQ75_13195 [Phycisphaerae bacterium]|nr:hypothetical protein [Phycisphaerae bacterium]
MIRKTLMIGLFTCLGLVLTGVTWLAHYENRYYEVLRLKKESERIPEAERKAKARELAAKVLHKYETTKYLTFRADCIHCWCTEDTWESRLPMNRWPRKRRFAEVNAAMTPDSLKTEISVKGKPVYTLFLKNGRFSEFKWPWNGIEGKHTEYPFNPHWFRLCRGVEPGLRCETGMYRNTWVGPAPNYPSWFKQAIEDGLWIGSAKVDGEQCDVVLEESYGTVLREDDNDPIWDRWDVFYINSKGFVVTWDLILHSPDALAKGRSSNRILMTKYYSGFNTDPIPPSTFSPSEVLLDESKTWRELTEAEALAELKDVSGVDLCD